MASAPALTVFGSVNLDLVVRCSRLPSGGETISGSGFSRHPGGKGANQALAAARLGARVRLVGAVGDDSEAAEATALLTAGGVELALAVSQQPTGIASILVADDGENQIVVVPGANASARAAQLAANEEPLLCQLELPPVEVAAALAAARGFTCLNAAPAAVEPLPEAVVERCDLVVVNRHEQASLRGTPRLLALTLGAEGAVLYEHGLEVARARPPAVEAADGTAAGDAFTACLLVSLLQGRHRTEALARACAAGALAASRPGAQPSLPTADELDAFVARSGR